MENSCASGAGKRDSQASGFRTVSLAVTGRVQGVYFRAWAKQRADALKLEGWVRNRRDGSVEMLISGPACAVEQMLDACLEGPPDAQVGKVEIIQEGGAAPSGFAVLPTG